MSPKDRDHFDSLIDGVMTTLPRSVRRIIDEVPIVVDDEPEVSLLRELGMNPHEEILCGLYTGTAMPDHSVEHVNEPAVVRLFRDPIVNHAGGWEAGDEAVREQIRVTILHEIGHHFGMEEDDLDGLGYG